MRFDSCKKQGIFLWILLLTPSLLTAQSGIERGTIVAGVGSTETATTRLHGSVSQAVAGRTEIGQIEARFGLWHRAELPNGRIVIGLPSISAEVGDRLTIPIEILEVEGRLPSGVIDFSARLRYNASLLDPGIAGGEPLRIGDTALLDVSGRILLTPGAIAEIEFLATLGNDTMTSIEITDFTLGRPSAPTSGESSIAIDRRDGSFTLLGVCREGGIVRLIHAAPTSARLVVRPNPVRTTMNLDFASVEAGQTRITLVDATGTEIVEIADFTADPERLYRIASDLDGIPSGSYSLVCRTPTETLLERVIVIE